MHNNLYILVFISDQNIDFILLPNQVIIGEIETKTLTLR